MCPALAVPVGTNAQKTCWSRVADMTRANMQLSRGIDPLLAWHNEIATNT
jgi:hypothetical protein